MESHEFLHNHPGLETQKGIKPDHVIVDRPDWERARSIAQGSIGEKCPRCKSGRTFSFPDGHSQCRSCGHIYNDEKVCVAK